MKKYASIFGLAFLLNLFPVFSIHAALVSIPDNNFRNYLKTTYPSCFVGDLMESSCSDIQNETVLNLGSKSISSLDGIEHFISLQQLYCYSNQLTNLPANLPSSISHLWCGTNLLTTVPSTLPSSLVWLDCRSNQITSLPASLPASLSLLACQDNELTTLPSLPPNLDRLDCFDNNLTSLPTLPSTITWLACYNNELTSLPALPNSLIRIYCYDNALTSLPTLPVNLFQIYCNGNQLTSLPALPSTLGELVCWNNKLTSIPALPAALTTLSCFNNQLTSLPALPASLQQLYCADNDLTSLPALPANLFYLYTLNNQLSSLPTLPNSLCYLYATGNGLTCLPNIPSCPTFVSDIGTTLCVSCTAPVLPVITGTTAVCANQTGVAYSIPSQTGVTYAWDVPSGATIISGAGTNSILVNFGSVISSVGVTVSNSCGNSQASLNLTSNGHYGLGDVTLTCSTVTAFCVPVRALSSLPNGIIGLDFVINYDPAIMTPTGTASVGAVATSYAVYDLNKNTPGKVYLTVYLSGAPSNTFMSGTGDIICVNFNLAASAIPGTSIITTENIVESMILSSQTICPAIAGTFTYSRLMKGQLYYRNATATNKRITGVTGNTTTTFTNTDPLCTALGSGVSNLLTSTGQFNMDVTGVDGLKIERDILGDISVPGINCANVQSVIGSSDRIMAAQISNMTIANPTIYELIAADVNLDGKVTAGDASLISQRSINAYNCEFPQVGNYSWNGTALVPSSTYSKSKDWIFIDQATLNSPAFTNAISKDNVPHAPECLGIATPACSTVADVVYQGILLGDVNGSWISSNSGNLKIGATTNEVIFDLTKSISLGDNLYEVPVRYSSDETLYGIDLEMDYAESTVQVESVSKNNQLEDLGLDWNDISNAKLMFTAYTEQGLSTYEPILYVQVKTAGEKIKSSDLGAFKVYINEEEANARVIENGNATSSIEAVFNNVHIYPNPANDVLRIDGIDISYHVKIYNLLGNEVFSKETDTKEVNVSALATGVYYLKLVSDNYEKVIRFSKIK